MYYHNIKHCDENNGVGLRVTLFVSGCCHNCKGCHNPQTHDPFSGIPFDEEAKQEIFQELSQEWCSGLTLSGGDPLFPDNRPTIFSLVKEIKEKFPNKTIWIYTGYIYESIKEWIGVKDILSYCDVIVDGPFIEAEKEYGLKWRGSKNQRVIDLHTKKTLHIIKRVMS